MAEPSLSSEALRAAAEELKHTPDDDRINRVAEAVTDALVDQAQHRAPAASAAFVDARVAALKLKVDDGATPTGRPLEIVRGGARNAAERALLAALVAWHLETLLDRRDGVHAVRGIVPALDWLEFTGHVPAYTAARETLDDDVLERLDAVLDGAPIEAATPAAAAAVRALRGKPPASPSSAPYREAPRASETVSIAGELEGEAQPGWRRLLWAVLWARPVRAVLRLVFSLRSPVTVSLDGDALRVHGHTELLGRTLRTWDERFPLGGLGLLRREAMFPVLPVAASAFALALGSVFGARSAIEGARGVYFPLVGLGVLLLVGGVLFDWLMRALFPGVTGRTRLTVRGKDGRGAVLTALPAGELDALIDAVDARLRGGGRPSVSPLSGATVRDEVPAPARHRAG
jgi:hypothetical protein